LRVWGWEWREVGGGFGEFDAGWEDGGGGGGGGGKTETDLKNSILVDLGCWLLPGLHWLLSPAEMALVVI